MAPNSNGIATTICLACGAQYAVGIRAPGQRCNGLENVRGLSDPSCPGKVVSGSLFVALAYELGFPVPPDAPPFPVIVQHAVVDPFWVVVQDEKGFIRVLKELHYFEAWARQNMDELVGEFVKADSRYTAWKSGFAQWQAAQDAQASQASQKEQQTAPAPTAPATQEQEPTE